VPFGAWELTAVGVVVLLPVVTALEEGGQRGLVVIGDGRPVIEAEVAGCAAASGFPEAIQ
jgi:hypothetical protein